MVTYGYRRLSPKTAFWLRDKGTTADWRFSPVHRPDLEGQESVGGVHRGFGPSINAETLDELRALQNEISRMHMIEDAIAAERDERTWLH